MANLVAGGFGGMDQGGIIAAERKRKLAEALKKEATTPQGQMVGGIYVAPSITQYLASGLKQYQAGKLDRESMEQEQGIYRDVQNRQQEAMRRYAEALKPKTQPGMEAGQPVMGQTNPTPEDLFRAQAEMAMTLGDPNAMMGATNAQLNYQIGQQTRQDDREFRSQEAEANRQQRMLELQLRMEDSRLSREQQMEARRELAQMQIEARRDIANIAAASRPEPAVTPVEIADPNDPKKTVMIDGRTGRVIGNAPSKVSTAKPLPPTALKMQNEALDAIGLASNIDKDLGAIEKKITDGKLDLGVTTNLLSKGKNLIGASDEVSRNFATFQATLEKLRNDSLRLNKGVQTEGDAQRAWNEILANINDEELVKQRLKEIRGINKRAADLHKLNVENIRANYNADQLDFSGYESQPSPLGDSNVKVVDW